MGKDEADIRVAAERIALEVADHGSGDIEIVFHDAVDNAGLKRTATDGRRGVNKNNGLAAVEFLVHGREDGIAGPFVAIAGPQADAVRLERVERVFNLAQTAIRVGQWQRGKMSEAPGV